MDKIPYRQKENIGKIIKDNLDYSSLDTKFVEIINQVKKFCNVLGKLKPNNDYTNLWTNLLDLDVVVLCNFPDLDFSGAYDFTDNEINIDEECIHKAINHELFHLASSKRNEFKTGFLIFDKDNYYLTGLNEGYTDLMAERYFDEEGYYEIEKDIAYLLEKIVTNKEMENFYYKADPDSLITKLKKYATIKEISSFFNNYDFISNFIDEENIMTKSEFYEIGHFLIKTYYSKEMMLYRKNIIDENRLIYDLSIYITLIKRYDLLDDLEIRTILYETVTKEIREKSLSLSKKM